MPHVPTVISTDHDRHDPLLVAALAAGDLAGPDRDQALALIRSCADCAALHDDLQAIARATASVPPPITTLHRDFRLTPADAARLRPAGWRRFLGRVSSPGPLTAPLGVALATLGLVGLLIGNVPFGNLSLGMSAGAAPPRAAENAGAGTTGSSAYDAAGPLASAAASAAAAPAAIASAGGAGGGPAASAKTGDVFGPAASASAGLTTSGGGVAGSLGSGDGQVSVVAGATAGPSVTNAQPLPGVPESTSSAGGGSPSLGTVIFIASIVAGLLLLALSRRRRPTLR